MSNKIVPIIYRAVIDDVITNIKHEFDEYGVSEEVLADLQNKWEQKVIDSHVAEFENPVQHAAHHPPHTTAHAHAPPLPQHPSYPPHPLHVQHHYPPHNPYLPPHPAQVSPLPAGPQVKAEPLDSRYVLNHPHYGIPPLSGPQIPGARQQMTYQPAPIPARTGPAPPAPTARYPPQSQQSHAQQRIPQVDGPSSSSSDSSSPPPPIAPRPSHPSLPQPSQSSTVNPDDEAINSDLDDSDSGDEEEGEEGTTADTDIVFCTYDKVARVKNKWKCILKDGMIHINGKDYLFAKCTGEFEW